MSFSINNSPSFKTDALPLDSTLSKGPDAGTTLSMSGAGFGHTPSAPKTEFSATLQRDGLNNAGVLTKLFDMFDQLISAMREMFSGKAEIANRLPHTDNAVIGKQDPGGQSVANAPTQSQVKGSSSSEAQTKSKLEEGSQPKDAPVAGTQSKERLPVGVLSKVISDVANQLKKKSSEDSHQAETHAPGLRVLSRAREPGINVTSESNPQIKVEVNVNHCHCPETSIEAGKDSRVIAGVTSRTHAPVPPERQVPTESVVGHVKSVVTEGKDATHGTEVKKNRVETVKTDGKDGKDGKDATHGTEVKESHVETAKTDGKDGKNATHGTEVKESHVETAKTDGKDGKNATHGTEVKESHVEPAKTDSKDGKKATHGTEVEHSHVEPAKTDSKDGKKATRGTEVEHSHVEPAKTDSKDGKKATRGTEVEHSHDEPAKTDGKDGKNATHGTELEHSRVEPAKTDAKDGKDAEHDSDHSTGLHPHNHEHEVAKPVTSGPRETTSQVSTPPTRGVTSPGPAENENDRWNQGFSSRSRLSN